MNNELFVILLAVLFGSFFTWAFKSLPREQWQIIAAVPMVKNTTGQWQGLNLTYYGFFQATSNTLGVAMAIVLLGAIGIPAIRTFALAAALFAICWPAARIVARVVEKKKYTFTIGGALFVGVIAGPWIIQSMNATLGGKMPVIPTLAAIAIAYAYGEGVGRLACISFGCCYGKKIEQAPPCLRRVFESIHFVFAGATKKAAYEGNLEGVCVVPIQAITAVLFTLIALAGTYLYLESRFAAALIATMAATQLWRFLSEILRADARGKARRFSAYQAMALIAIVYLIFIAAFFDTVVAPTDVSAGLGLLWSPSVLIFCQRLWLTVFLITGRSMVTGSTLTFFVHQDRV